MLTRLDLIDREYDQLTVKRDLDGTGERFHCLCRCGRYRTCSRRQLIAKAVKSCAKCALANRNGGGGKPKPEIPLPPEPKLAKITLPECRGCTVRIIEGKRYDAIQPDCVIHSRLYDGIILRGPELVGVGRC